MDHVIAYRATYLVEMGLHVLTLLVSWFVRVHAGDVSEQPGDEIKTILAGRGARANLNG